MGEEEQSSNKRGVEVNSKMNHSSLNTVGDIQHAHRHKQSNRHADSVPCFINVRKLVEGSMSSTLRASVLDVPSFPISESVVKCCRGNITSCQTQTLRVMVLMHQTLNYDRHKKKPCPYRSYTNTNGGVSNVN